MYTLPEEYSRHAAQTTDAGWYRVWSGPETVTTRKTCTQKGDRRKRSHRTFLRIKIQIHNTFEKEAARGEKEREIGVPGWQIRGPRPELLHISYMKTFWCSVTLWNTPCSFMWEADTPNFGMHSATKHLWMCKNIWKKQEKVHWQPSAGFFFALSFSLSHLLFPRDTDAANGPEDSKAFQISTPKAAFGFVPVPAVGPSLVGESWLYETLVYSTKKSEVWRDRTTLTVES